MKYQKGSSKALTDLTHPLWVYTIIVGLVLLIIAALGNPNGVNLFGL